MKCISCKGEGRKNILFPSPGHREEMPCIWCDGKGNMTEAQEREYRSYWRSEAQKGKANADV